MVVPRENTTLKSPRDRLIYSGTEGRRVLYSGAVQSGFRIIYFIYYSMNCSTTGWRRNGGRGWGGGGWGALLEILFYSFQIKPLSWSHHFLETTQVQAFFAAKLGCS